MPKPQSESNLPIGQLLIVGFDGTEMSSRLRSLLSRIQPAGVILFARNIVSAQQTFRLLKDCQSCVSTPLFTCVDMEGGTVDRFRNVIGASPSATDVFATGDRKLFRKHGAIIGKACRTLGFNTDLAPVVDLALDNSCKVLGSRVVSSDPKQSALYAREFLSGLGAELAFWERSNIFLVSAQPIWTHTRNFPVWRKLGSNCGGTILLLIEPYAARHRWC